MKKLILIFAGLLAFATGHAAGAPGGEFNPRSGLPNFFAKAQSARAVKIVYLGGSITAAQNGWRDITCDWFRINYPETVVSQVNAGIGGTGSNLGVFRTESDVLSQNPDLVFVEFAVNDGGRDPQSIVRTMEGIVRKIWAASPKADICFVYTTDEHRFTELAKGNVAPAILAMEQVAEHYGIPSINMAYRVLELAEAGKLVFTAPAEQNSEKIVFTSDKVHPLSESGHPIYASVIAGSLAKIASDSADRPHTLPAPLASDNWEKARKVELSRVEMSGWELLADDELARSYERFVKAIYKGRPGSRLRFSFRGTVLGLYDFLGPRSGKLIVTVDGKRSEVMRFDRHCSYDRLANVILFENLEDKVHDVEIEVSGEQLDKASILGPEHLEKMKKSPAMFKGIEYKIGSILIVGDLVSSAPRELEAELKRADDLWRAGKLPQAAAVYEALTAGSGLKEEYASLVWLRLAEAQFQSGKREECGRTLDRMEKLAWLPAFHKVKMEDLRRSLRGENLAYRTPVELPAVVAATLHVDPSFSGGDGSLRKPYNSLDEALAAAGRMIGEGRLPEGAVEVLLHGPRYDLKGTVKMGRSCSGTARNPLVIRSASASKPTQISGGVYIRNWKVETDPAVLELLPASAQGKVLVADLAANGVTGVDRIVFGGFGSGRSKSGTYRFNTMPVPELFCNGRVQELSRWPNDRDTVASINKFCDPRAEKWGREDDVWLHGYWKYLYADSYEKVESFKNNRLQLTPPYNRYGFSDFTRGFITESRWYALNLLSEMDRPGEWKISADRGKIWLYPPKDFDPEKCILSTYGTGIELDSCDYVTVRDVEIAYTRGDGVVANGCDNLSFINCHVHDLSGLGIQILGGKGHTLHSLRIESMGRGGIYIQSGDKTTLEPSESLVENCYVSDLSRIDRTYTPAVLLDGVGIRVQHCRFEYIPSSAIRLEGNDMLIQLNEFAHCVQESNDQGAIDIWFNSLFRGNVIRWNYFHDIGSTYRMAGAVRMDDAISGVAVVENIMRRSATHIFGSVQIHGGNYNTIEGNLMIENKAAVSNTLWPDEYWVNHFRNDRTVKILNGTPWKSSERWAKYPELKHLYDNPNLNFIRDNKIIACPEVYLKNSFTERNNRIDKAEFFNNEIVPAGRVSERLDKVGRLADPWHRIPVGEIGLYDVKR